MTPDLDTIREWLESHYNEYVSVYDFGDYLRLTDGSAGHYVDIEPVGGTLSLRGRRHEKSVDRECEATEAALIAELRSGAF